MRVLITNDDGVDSVGIQVLAATLANDGRFDVIVVAPDGDRSGVGASLGGVTPDGLSAHRVQFPDAPDIEAWALDGPPAMCVLATRLGGFGEAPDLVVSGINAGLNTGRAVLHSGTVGAALTGQNFGMSGLAVSLQSGDRWRWDTAAQLAIEAMDLLIAAPPKSVLNLNVPALDREDIGVMRWARLAPFGEVRTVMTATDTDPGDGGPAHRSLRMELALAEAEFADDCDTGLVRAGFASLTTIVGVAEAWPDDAAAGDADDVEEIEARLMPGAPVHPTQQVPDRRTA